MKIFIRIQKKNTKPRWEKLPSVWADNIMNLLTKQFRVAHDKLENIKLFIIVRPLLCQGMYGLSENRQNHMILIAEWDNEKDITLVHELKHMSWFITRPYTMCERMYKKNRCGIKIRLPRFTKAFRRIECAAIKAEKKYGHLKLIDWDGLKYFWRTNRLP